MAGSNRDPPVTITRMRPPRTLWTRRNSTPPRFSPTRRVAPFSASSPAKIPTQDDIRLGHLGRDALVDQIEELRHAREDRDLALGQRAQQLAGVHASRETRRARRSKRAAAGWPSAPARETAAARQGSCRARPRGRPRRRRHVRPAGCRASGPRPWGRWSCPTCRGSPPDRPGWLGQAGSGGAGMWPPIMPSKLTVSSAWPCSRTMRQSLPAAARPARTVSRYFGDVKNDARARIPQQRVDLRRLVRGVERDGDGAAPENAQVRRAPVRVVVGQDGAAFTGPDADHRQPGGRALGHLAQPPVGEAVDVVLVLDLDRGASRVALGGPGKLFEEILHARRGRRRA